MASERFTDLDIPADTKLNICNTIKGITKETLLTLGCGLIPGSQDSGIQMRVNALECETEPEVMDVEGQAQ